MAVSTNETNAKLHQKGSCGGHVTHFHNFVTPNMSGMVETKNFIFNTDMDGSENKRKMQN